MIVTITPFVFEFLDDAEGPAKGTVYVQCRACMRYGIKPQPHACGPLLKGGNWYARFETVVAIRARQLKNTYRWMNYLSTPDDAPRDAVAALEEPAVLGDATPAEEAPCPTSTPESTPSLITLPASSSPEPTVITL